MVGVWDHEPPLAVDIGVGRELAGGEVSRGLAVLRPPMRFGLLPPYHARLGPPPLLSRFSFLLLPSHSPPYSLPPTPALPPPPPPVTPPRQAV